MTEADEFTRDVLESLIDVGEIKAAIFACEIKWPAKMPADPLIGLYTTRGGIDVEVVLEADESERGYSINLRLPSRTQ